MKTNGKLVTRLLLFLGSTSLLADILWLSTSAAEQTKGLPFFWARATIAFTMAVLLAALVVAVFVSGEWINRDITDDSETLAGSPTQHYEHVAPYENKQEEKRYRINQDTGERYPVMPTRPTRPRRASPPRWNPADDEGVIE